MMRWDWYWRVKKIGYKRKQLCSGFWLCEIDSFSMYKHYKQVEMVRESSDRCALYIPRFKLKAYLQDNDDLLVEYQNGSYRIPVERKPCNFGGYYFFFHCPLCDKRMRKLYNIDGQYQCRKCGNLGYLSQLLNSKLRFSGNQRNIERRIQRLGGNLELNIKPPRMHRPTFKHLKEKAKYYSARQGLVEFQELREWYGPKIEPYLSPWFEYEWTYTVKEYLTKKNNHHTSK